MKHESLILAASMAAFFLVTGSCSTQRKVTALKEGTISPTLTLAGENAVPDFDATDLGKVAHRDTLKVMGDDGKELLIMKAIKDDESGEMVANEVLDAAVVTARFRNVAERHGKVDLQFQIEVPKSMQDSKWQLRFYPDMYILEDSIRLDPVIITGAQYRKGQLRGYQLYQRFLDSIIQDTTIFINQWQLDIFLERNIPQVFKYRNDSSYVSEEVFYSYYGVSEQRAVKHYTNQFRVAHNNRKKRNIGKMYARYVKAPIVTDGIRLDTVMVSDAGDFTYVYTQTINTRPKLRKVDIVLSGDIWDQDKKVYNIPRSEPLTFYISSLSSFVDGTERYLTQTVYRKVETNTACHIDFEVAKADVREDLSHNAEEIGRIKENLRDLLVNEKFDLDSIVVTAYSSPEGKVTSNEQLSQRRSDAVSKYFDRYMKTVRDSIRREQGIVYNLDETYEVQDGKVPDIRFIGHNGGENWKMLDNLVATDTLLTEKQRDNYLKFSDMKDLDAREGKLQNQDYYRYLRESVYPRLRTVRFDFHLHRKGMVEETMETTVLDTVYMAGVQAIRDRDYETAVTLLRPYNDYNAAIAFCSLDYNASAMAILRNLERTAPVNYMLAVLYSREGDDQQAVQCYLDACREEPTYVHRGNLDPEIAELIRRYNLLSVLEPEDEFEYDM